MGTAVVAVCYHVLNTEFCASALHAANPLIRSRQWWICVSVARAFRLSPLAVGHPVTLTRPLIALLPPSPTHVRVCLYHHVRSLTPVSNPTQKKEASKKRKSTGKTDTGAERPSPG